MTAARRRARGRESQIAFEALTIEGGLLSPDWLSRLAQLQAGQQSEVDYRIPKGLNLRDEIGRYWRIAQAHWTDLAAGLARRSDPEALARAFVPALLREVFGFASLAPIEALVRDDRSFPIGFVALGGKVPVVVAPAASGLDTLAPRFGEEGKRRSAFGLAQEFLNATDQSLWSLVCDGVSLLELVPQLTDHGRRFGFAGEEASRGNARKTTGSYYTPDSLVQVLLDSALDPVVKDTLAAHPEAPVEALLSLAIVDPACGSGHFLLAAARRLAAQVARLEANGTPSAAQYRHALRQVVSRCIYGVDLNPMAIELCKVSLWMEAVEPGRPLSFLDSHLQHGNALLGTTPELLAKGVPDSAWEPIEGDDKKVASSLKKRNKQAAKGQRGLEALWAKAPADDGETVTRAVEALDQSADEDLDAVVHKAATWDEIRASAAYRQQKFVADAWCAAFVWPKITGPLVEAAPTNDLWLQLRDKQGTAPALTVKTVGELAAQYRFFHWHLAFPQVFKRGGFDVVLGNPPWERVKLQEQEFFASRDEGIRALSSFWCAR